jgi:dTDP-glucose 4,6-dehydratase
MSGFRAHPPLPVADLEHAIAAVPGGVEGLRSAVVLLTGGTGFFGSWLVEALLHADVTRGLGLRLVVVSRDPDAFLRRMPHLANRTALTFVRSDVRAFTLEAPRPTHVVHGATTTDWMEQRRAPLELVDVVASGTRHTLELAVRHRACRFLLLSSGAVYGPLPSELTHVPEGFPGAPHVDDPHAGYANAKRFAEHLAFQYRAVHGLSVNVARCFAFAGQRLPLDTHFALGNFVRDAFLKRDVRVLGDGSPHRSYLHAADLSAWLLAILLHAPDGRTYNVGSEDGRTLAEVAHVVGRIGGVGVRVEGRPLPERPASRYVPSTARARGELGVKQAISLEESIERMLAYSGARAPSSDAP